MGGVRRPAPIEAGCGKGPRADGASEGLVRGQGQPGGGGAGGWQAAHPELGQLASRSSVLVAVFLYM